MSERALPAPLLQVVRDLARWLDVSGVPGALIGGMAAGLLGRPRTTRDVDALIWLDDDNLDPFLRTGDQFGFQSRVGSIRKFARQQRVILLRHRPTGLEVDLVLGALPFERKLLAQAVGIHLQDVIVPVAAPADLIVMKAVAHRPRDLADVEGLLDAHPRLDRNRIRRQVREFSAALDAPEILTDLEKILSRGRRRKGPRKKKR